MPSWSFNLVCCIHFFSNHVLIIFHAKKSPGVIHTFSWPAWRPWRVAIANAFCVMCPAPPPPWWLQELAKPINPPDCTWWKMQRNHAETMLKPCWNWQHHLPCATFFFVERLLTARTSRTFSFGWHLTQPNDRNALDWNMWDATWLQLTPLKSHWLFVPKRSVSESFSESFHAKLCLALFSSQIITGDISECHSLHSQKMIAVTFALAGYNATKKMGRDRSRLIRMYGTSEIVL